MSRIFPARIQQDRLNLTISAEALHAALLVADSATEVLERLFCVPVSVRRLPSSTARPQALTGENFRHRTVELVGSGRVLSQADLWFRPEFLTGEMLRTLEETDVPFGRVVRDLALRRRLMSWRVEGGRLEHRALLETGGGDVVAEVFERYARG